MVEKDNLEKFIPVRTNDIVSALCNEGVLSEERQQNFKRFAELVQAIYHFRFHDTLKKALDAYHAFNPDADTLKLFGPEEDFNLRFNAMVEALEEMLSAANCKELSLEELNEIMTKAAPGGLNVKVNQEKYDKILIYRRERRGNSQDTGRCGMVEQVPVKKRRNTETEDMLRDCSSSSSSKRGGRWSVLHDYYVETAGETGKEKRQGLVTEAVRAAEGPRGKGVRDTDDLPEGIQERSRLTPRDSFRM